MLINRKHSSSLEIQHNINKWFILTKTNVYEGPCPRIACHLANKSLTYSMYKLEICLSWGFMSTTAGFLSNGVI